MPRKMGRPRSWPSNAEPGWSLLQAHTDQICTLHEESATPDLLKCSSSSPRAQPPQSKKNKMAVASSSEATHARFLANIFLTKSTCLGRNCQRGFNFRYLRRKNGHQPHIEKDYKLEAYRSAQKPSSVNREIFSWMVFVAPTAKIYDTPKQQVSCSDCPGALALPRPHSFTIASFVSSPLTAIELLALHWLWNLQIWILPLLPSLGVTAVEASRSRISSWWIEMKFVYVVACNV